MIIVLNGEPRSGKTTLAEAIARGLRPVTLVGVDSKMAELPADQWPGIGLRPGGEHPELEPDVWGRYRVLWNEVVELADEGRHVVVDVGLHREYASDLDPWELMRTALAGHDVLVVGVRCALDEILRRRAASGYLSAAPGEPVPEPVLRWHEAVHRDAMYDLEVDTTTTPAADLAVQVLALID